MTAWVVVAAASIAYGSAGGDTEKRIATVEADVVRGGVIPRSGREGGQRRADSGERTAASLERRRNRGV
jgi:hypothetical protein